MVQLLSALLLAALQAQPPSQEQLKANLEAKLKAPFLAKAPWITDFDKARDESKKSGKPIFAYFTRSYAK
jgi:hypothetical protein